MTENRPINVVHICDHLGWPGSRMHGVKRLFTWMLPRFDSNRFRVSLVSLRGPDTSEDTLESQGIDVTYLSKSKFDPFTLPALVRELQRRRADIVHMHGYGATTFGRLAARYLRLPTVLHEHANLTDTPWFQKIADWVLVTYTDLAIAVSRSTADFVVNARLIPRERTRVVYLGAPLEEFSRVRSSNEVRLSRLELGLPEKGLVVGTITRLMPSKGNQYFVEAAKLVLDHGVDATFCIVGEGELSTDLKDQVSSLGLSGRLIFPGFTRDVAGAFSAFDLAVFPSLWEGTPLTAFEALAAGRTIISSDADGLLDILHPDVDAIIVPKRNGQALATAIVSLLQSPARRKELGESASVTGRSYDIAMFVKKMEQLYLILYERRGSTGRSEVSKADLSFLANTAHPS